MRFVKPLDVELVKRLAKEHDYLVTVEEGCTMGGAGSAVAEALAAEGIVKPLLILGLPDKLHRPWRPGAAAGLRRPGRERHRQVDPRALRPGRGAAGGQQYLTDDSEDNGETNLRRSLARVLETGLPDTLPAVRYPIPVTLPNGDIVYEERFWDAMSTPIFGADGRIQCILHTNNDVTDRCARPGRCARARRDSGP
jgi:hypothetical protein